MTTTFRPYRLGNGIRVSNFGAMVLFNIARARQQSRKRSQ